MPSYKASTVTERPDHVKPGEYELEVLDAVESISKRGHEMIELKLKSNADSILFDFLVFTEAAFWKIDSFLTAIGWDYTPGEDVEVIGEDLIGRTGRARLIVDEYDGRLRNKVASWLTMPAAQTTAAKPAPEEHDDERIPF